MSFVICLKFVIFLTLWIVDGNDAYNFTDKMASECKEYFCRGGDYTNYFRVKSEHTASPGLRFEMHLAMKGPRDGHILLSPVLRPGYADPVYEIVIGAGNNSYSELRRMKRKFGKISVNTEGILSSTKYSPFWLQIRDDGTVEFGEEGQELALISYRDPSPLEIRYFSFASYLGVEIKVLYDCPFQNNTNITDDSEMVKPNLTARQQLKVDLLKNYNPGVMPKPMDFLNKDPLLQSVLLHFNTRGISYDVAKSQVTTHGTLTTVWKDSRLIWNMTDYDNVSTIFFNHGEIWEPELVIHEALDLDAMNHEKTSLNLRVLKSGNVVKIQKLHVTTWCSPGPGLSQWPKDIHTCSVKIGLWSLVGFLKIIGVESFVKGIGFMNELDEELFISSEWDLLEMNNINTWSTYTPLPEKNYSDDNTLNITVTIQRKPGTYTMLYFTPFVGSVIIVLLSFWIPSSHVTKMTILCLNLVFVTVCLAEVLNKMPTYMIVMPNIVKFYLYAIFCMWISLIINGFLLKLTTDPKPWPVMHYNLKKLLTSPVAVTLGLILPKKYDTYKQMSNDAVFQLETSEEEEDKENRYWELLATAVDRIVFFVLLIVYTTIFFTHY